MALLSTLMVAMAAVSAMASPQGLAGVLAPRGKGMAVAQSQTEGTTEVQDDARVFEHKINKDAPVKQQLYPRLPEFKVPGCLETGPDLITFDKNASVPDKKPFPKTEVHLCYDQEFVTVTFTCAEEPYFYSDGLLHTQGDTETYHESVGVLMARGDDDPWEYLDIQVDPKNISYTAFIFNRCTYGPLPGPYQCPLDIQLLQTPDDDNIQKFVETKQQQKKIWSVAIAIPFKLFNIKPDDGRNKKWRMNFSRTVCGKDTCNAKDALLGAWSVPGDKKSMHQSQYFGHITFV